MRALGGWAVTLDGRPVATGANQKIVLHALVLGRGRVDRGDLALLLPNHDLDRAGQSAAIRNALHRLRRLGFEIARDDNPIFMSPSQPNADIDLWDFFAHVELERYAEALDLISAGQEPYLLTNDEDPSNPIWAHTLRDFRAARDMVVAARDAATGRRRSMLETRERLLARALVPGVGDPVSIRDIRTRLEHHPFPWRCEGPDAPPGDTPVSDYLCDVLAGSSTALPHQIVIVGPPGAGKTLTAISTYLRLTDDLDRAPSSRATRTVLYVDAEAESWQPGFGEDAWLEQRLRDMGGDAHGRPVVIMSHADAFLGSRQGELAALLYSRLFRDCDVLICCSSHFYSRRLAYEDFGTHVVQLEPWGRALQLTFARVVFGERTASAFEAWRDGARSRHQLCARPLQLVHVLSLIDGDPDALPEIATPSQLFEGVARMRLRVAGARYDEDELMQDLAAFAQRFYVDATPADAPIACSTEELKHFMRGRHGDAAARRAEWIMGRTLLTVTSAPRDALRFEAPAWGSFFVARHLTDTVIYHPTEALTAFSKFLSADVMDLCVAMLREALDRHAAAIRRSLRRALDGEEDARSDLGRRRIARAQVAYVLAVMADRAMRRELAALVDGQGSEREPDPLIRRGIAFGLAESGDAEAADRYVDLMRDERADDGAGPTREANISFMLTLRGDQRFDPERPTAIERDVVPVRTIGNLVRRLEALERSAAWRIDLFTLLDLGAHPAIPRECYRRALEPHVERMRVISDRLAGDPGRSDWPEIGELSDLLDAARGRADGVLRRSRTGQLTGSL